MRKSSRSASFHRFLVKALLPAWFRDQHGDDVTEVFQELLLEARASRGFRGSIAVWTRELVSLARLAWQARRTHAPAGTGARGGLAGASRGFSWLDAKLGLRMLVAHPGLTLAAGFALVVGIPVGLAPTHAAYSFQADLPVDEGDRVHILKPFDPVRFSWAGTDAADYLFWSERLTSFEAMGAAVRSQFNLDAVDGEAEPVIGSMVTPFTFDLLRVPPALGRSLVSADGVIGGPDVVVVSHQLWQTRLGGAPDVVGSDLRINGVPHTVVGVMPEGFLFPYRDHLWMPLRLSAATEAGGPNLMVYGRLASGATSGEAQAELTAVGTVPRPGEDNRQLQPEVVPYSIGVFGFPKGGLQAVPGFYFFQMFALLILAVACANIAMLVLARTSARTGELAVRSALGASRGRIVAQLFTESFVLSVLAAGVGLLIADQVAHHLTWLTDLLPYWVSFRVTPAIVLWALSLAAFSAALVGAVPALKVTGKRVQRSIQRAAAGRSGMRFGGVSSALIVIDVAVAVAAVGIAIGLSDGLTQLESAATVRGDHVLTARFRIPPVGHLPGQAGDEVADEEARMATIQTELVRRLREQAGVRTATAATVLPGMDHRRRPVDVDGAVLGEDEDDRAWFAYVDDGFFEALEAPILSGRGFQPSDFEAEPSVVIVNRSFAEKRMGGRNPVGRRLRIRERGSSEPGPWLEVIGVVGSLGMNAGNPGRDTGVYHPLQPGEHNPIYVAASVGENPLSFMPTLREIASSVEPASTVTDPVPLSEVFSFEGAILSWVKLGMNAMIGILLALSISGTYALMNFTVSERTREIGIRAALGAPKVRIALTIARRALLQLGVGVGIGTVVNAVLLMGFKAEGRIPTYSPILLTILAGVAVMLLVGSLACVAPTRKALRIAPTHALRNG